MKQILIGYQTQDIAPWVTPFCYFVEVLKLFSGDLSQMLRNSSQ